MIDNSFIDTNILVYSCIKNEEVKHKKAVELFSNIVGGANVFISSQVLGELYNVLTKYKIEHNIIKEFLYELCEVSMVQPISKGTVKKALKIKERYGFSYWDSLIISAALETDCSILYSEDMTDGQKIEDRITIVNPF